MENCDFYEECKNKNNFKKCSVCENNPVNFEIIEKNDFEGEVHERRNKRFYIYTDNFEDY